LRWYGRKMVKSVLTKWPQRWGHYF
jgi:hypothetical protein